MSVHFINNVVATIMEITSFDIYMIQLPWIVPSLIITIIATVLLAKYIIKETQAVKKIYS
jgi:hypothetical protein